MKLVARFPNKILHPIVMKYKPIITQIISFLISLVISLVNLLILSNSYLFVNDINGLNSIITPNKRQNSEIRYK